ncbi:MAG: CehA/McbA family metallohydrolase [Syntrophales bacterium]|nr:CehA/McbA family metallohydrolase [Syntrophales bacterium]
MSPLHDYAGVIHLHSAYSFDGHVAVPEILRAARDCGLDFVMLTDHGTLRARDEGLEGWHDGLLLIVGEEISPRFNHYLAFQIQDAVEIPEGGDASPPQGYIDAVERRGGFGFIAHPDHGGNELFHVKHYPWQDWSVTGCTGMGIWDFMTDWQETLTGRGKAIWCYLQPALVLTGPKPETLRRWDQLNRRGKIVGIGELDNHGTRRRFLGLTVSVFPFRRAFQLIRTHLLTERPLTGHAEQDIPLLCGALRNGRAYIALEAHREAKGFSFSVTGTGGTASLGDECRLDGSSKLRVRLPDRGRIRVIRNGRMWQEAAGTALDRPLREPGCYRVEVWRRVLGRHRPWIYSNPIYVRPGTAPLPDSGSAFVLTAPDPSPIV